MNLAAIDIGSNGARMQISRVLINPSAINKDKPVYSLKEIEYVRFPLRLGEDVFQNFSISEKKQAQILKLLHAFKLLVELFECEDMLAVATSAFREANNGQNVIQQIHDQVGINLQIIEGAKEAEYLSLIIYTLLEPDKIYLHIDVGGGSTEFNFYVNAQKISSKSFPIGSIRQIDSQTTQAQMEAMQYWIRQQVSVHNPKKAEVFVIGTGGNINKMNTLVERKTQFISIQDIRTLYNYISKMSMAERINKLKLNPDRADTILPATHIYLTAMQWAGAKNIFIPKVGLKDGILQYLMQKNISKIVEKDKVL